MCCGRCPWPSTGTKLTLALVDLKLKEHRIAGVPLNVVRPGDVIRLGCFQVRFLHVNHSIAGAVALAITCPAGTVVFSGDFKVDYTPIDGQVTDLAGFAELGSKGVLAFLCESTNIERKGYTMSETKIGQTFIDMFQQAKGRVIVAMFASNIHRVQMVVDSAAMFGRRVCFVGRSMVNVTRVAMSIGELSIPEENLIDVDDLENYADEEILVVTTGSQGEAMAGLTRMAYGEHRKLQIRPTDMVILSAHPIPGNEKPVARVINQLYRCGANVIYGQLGEVHVSGHACQEEIKLLHALVKPKYFLPIHGEYSKLWQHAELAEALGTRSENIVIPRDRPGHRDEPGQPGHRGRGAHGRRAGGRPWHRRRGQRGPARPQAPQPGRPDYRRHGHRPRQRRAGVRPGYHQPRLRLRARERGHHRMQPRAGAQHRPQLRPGGRQRVAEHEKPHQGRTAPLHLRQDQAQPHDFADHYGDLTLARSLEKLAFGELFRHVEGVKRGHTAMNQHQAAIWGAGGIAQTHAMALRAVGISIRTVVSHSEAGARAFAQQWGIPEWSTDPAALLDASVGSVHVCTPPGLHYEMVKFLLEHGRHVLCEKPLCLDPDQAGELAHLARETGLACAVNLNVRFHPACQEAKARVADPAFGPVFLVHGAYLQEFHALPAPDGWRYDEAVGGTQRRGPSPRSAPTGWISAEYLTGERITSVQALFGRFQPQRLLKDGMMEPPAAAEGVPVTVRSEDSALLHFRMAGGAIGSAVLSEVSHGRTNRLSLEITGKNRSLWWDSEASTALHEASKGSGVQTALYPFGFNGFTDTFITLAARYYAALGWTFPARQGDFPTFEDGARLAYLCRAVERSARENGVWADV